MANSVNFDGSSFKLIHPNGSCHFKTQEEAIKKAESMGAKWYAVRIYHKVDGNIVAGPYVAQTADAILEP